MTALILLFPNTPDQDRASDCKANPELTGHSWKERQERVILILPVVRIERECPKVQELRRQSKRLREYFKRERELNT